MTTLTQAFDDAFSPLIETISHLFILTIIWFVLLIAAIALSVFIMLPILVFTGGPGVMPDVITTFYVLLALCAWVVLLMWINGPK
jgi:hypothetical protein